MLLLLHEVAPKNAGCRGSHATWPHKRRTQLSGETAAIHRPANSEPSAWRLKPPSGKGLHPGDSFPVILVVVRQVGNMEICFRLGQPESRRPELIRVETQAHRLIRVGPRQTQGSHHLDSAMHEFFETETNARVGSAH